MRKTIFYISDMSALGIRLEMDVQGIEKQDRYFRITGTLRGKRKPVRLSTQIKDCAIIDGWDIPLMLDNEKKEGVIRFSGNCLLNFLSDSEKVKAVFDKNENPEFNKGLLIHVEQENGDKETPVYPTEAQEYAPHCAPLQTIMEKGREEYV